MREVLITALEEIVKKDVKRMYWGCLECDEKECGAIKECKAQRVSEIGRIAEKALKEYREQTEIKVFKAGSV